MGGLKTNSCCSDQIEAQRYFFSTVRFPTPPFFLLFYSLKRFYSFVQSNYSTNRKSRNEMEEKRGGRERGKNSRDFFVIPINYANARFFIRRGFLSPGKRKLPRDIDRHSWISQETRKITVYTLKTTKTSLIKKSGIYESNSYVYAAFDAPRTRRNV